MSSAYVEEQLLSSTQDLKNNWMRKIQIIFTSKKAHGDNKGYRLVIGDNDESLEKTFGELKVGDYNKTGVNYNIKISGSKFLALLKDKGTIEISNLEYDVIALIMAEELYRIEIKIGYKSLDSLITVAKGEVSYISQKIHSHHDTTTYISYASEYVASFSQSRINFNINSSINLYTMLNELFLKQGAKVNTIYLSPRLKEYILNEVYSNYGTTTTIIDSVIGMTGGSYSLSTDSSIAGNVISCTNLQEKRVIKINPNQINITKGNPTVTSQGLQISLIPVFNFIPGDILQIDNSYFDISSGTTKAESVQNTFNQSYIDANGQYMIQQIDYELENRGKNFVYNIKARAVSLFKNISGAN